MKDIQKLLFTQASEVMKRAYSPYSQFLVGSSLITDNNNIYSGCNVENSALGVTVCAELNAITTMVAAGERKIRSILVVSSSEDFCSPCGICRQAISEFSDDKTIVYFCTVQGEYQKVLVNELLPFSFSASHFR